MTRTNGWPAVLGGRRVAERYAAGLESRRAPADPELVDLVTLARALAPAAHAPSPAFRERLRAQLVEEASARPRVVPTPRGSAVQREARPRVRRTAALVAALSVAAGTGTTVASNQALPGDALYGLKRGVEGAQLALARDDLGRGRELLEQAGTRLGEAQRLAGGTASSTQVAAALDAYDAAVDAGAVALADSYRETGAEEPLQLLAGFAASQQPLLEALRDDVGPGLRARVQAALDLLAVLRVRSDAVLGPAAAVGVGSRPVGSRAVVEPPPRRTPTSPADAPTRRQATDEQRPSQGAEQQTGTGEDVLGGTGTRANGDLRGDAGTPVGGDVRVDTGPGPVDAGAATGTGSTGSAPTPAAPAPAPTVSTPVAPSTPAAPDTPVLPEPSAAVPPVEAPPADATLDVQAPCPPTDRTC